LKHSRQNAQTPALYTTLDTGVMHNLSHVNLLGNAWARRYDSAVCCSKIYIFGAFYSSK